MSSGIFDHGLRRFSEGNVGAIGTEAIIKVIFVFPWLPS
jgi:hypothetical protein